MFGGVGGGGYSSRIAGFGISISEWGRRLGAVLALVFAFGSGRPA